MYVDSSDLNSPVAMETDIPLIEDVQRLKKTVEEGATQVNLTLSLMSLSLTLLASQLLICVSRPELKKALQSLRTNRCVCGMSFLHGAPNCSVFFGYLLRQKVFCRGGSCQHCLFKDWVLGFCKAPTDNLDCNRCYVNKSRFKRNATGHSMGQNIDVSSHGRDTMIRFIL